VSALLLPDEGKAFQGALNLCTRAFGGSGVHAFIGAASSSSSIQAAMISKELGVPQLSFASTSASLSDAEKFPLFARMPPSDVLQAHAMADMAFVQGWSFVATVHSEESYGMSGIREFRTAAELLSVEVISSSSFMVSRRPSVVERIPCNVLLILC
jgi:ABC-type branched-subunit amino acid transport system substrate-binding protein